MTLAYPNVEDVIFLALADIATCDSVTPADLLGSLPFIKANRIGGPRLRYTDYPTVELSFFGPTYAVARSVAEQGCELLIACPIVTEAGRIDSVEGSIGPFEVDYADPNVRRFLATFNFSTRRQAS